MRFKVSELKPSPLSGRIYFHEPPQDLIESIKRHGVLFPILISEDGRIISGHRRVNACKRLGIEEIEAEIRSDTGTVTIESNRYRQKTWKEKLREAEAIEKILRPKAEENLRTHTKQGYQKSEKAVDTLKETAKAIGLSHDTFHKVKTIAEKRPELLKEIDEGKKSVNSAYKIVKEEERRRELELKPIPLPQGKFRVIYADPPWQYSNTGFDTSAERHYPTMSIEEISDLPVKEFAGEDSVLFLWVTNPMIKEGLKAVTAWGFDYKTNFVWVKDRSMAGFYNRGQHELLFIATRGSCLPREGSLTNSVLEYPRTEHSRKPAIIYELIEAMYPGPYLELFARTKRENWIGWGNEI